MIGKKTRAQWRVCARVLDRNMGPAGFEPATNRSWVQFLLGYISMKITAPNRSARVLMTGLVATNALPYFRLFRNGEALELMPYGTDPSRRASFPSRPGRWRRPLNLPDINLITAIFPSTPPLIYIRC